MEGTPLQVLQPPPGFFEEKVGELVSFICRCLIDLGA